MIILIGLMNNQSEANCTTYHHGLRCANAAALHGPSLTSVSVGLRHHGDNQSRNRQKFGLATVISFITSQISDVGRYLKLATAIITC